MFLYGITTPEEWQSLAYCNSLENCRTERFREFESHLFHQTWLVRIMAITADCLSAHGSSILPRVAKFCLVRLMVGPCSYTAQTEVRFLHKAPRRAV